MSFVPMDKYSDMVMESGTLQMISRVSAYHEAVSNSKNKTAIPQYRFRWPEVSIKTDGKFSEPFFSKTCVGFAER